MDYKKKYKDALERAKDFMNDKVHYALRKGENIMCWIFPELRESEDERIRKEILEYFQQFENEELRGVNISDWIAWLEKQGESSDKIHYWTEEEIEPIISDYLRGAEHYGGMIARLRCLKPKSLEKQDEQKPVDFKAKDWYVSKVDGKIHNMTYNPTDKVEPKFKVGDWIVDSQGLTHQIERVVENVTTHTFGYDIVGGGYFNDDNEGVHLWTIQDAKDGDVLVDGTFVGIFKENSYNPSDEYYGCMFLYCSFDMNNDKFYTESGGYNPTYFHPATKEQRELLFSKMKEAGFNWDAKKKILTRFIRTIKPNDENTSSTWREEDEWYLKSVISRIKEFGDSSVFGLVNNDIQWLKSLKQRLKGE